ncbi:MAG: ribulose-phosphate 3-epimerase, partial [Bermanella sp.]
QSFIPATLDKLRQVRQRIEASGYDIRLEVDGGVNINNIAEISAAGADMFVAGSAIFNSNDYAQTIAEMRAQIAQAQA